MLAHRLRRWANINPTSDEILVLLGYHIFKSIEYIVIRKRHHLGTEPEHITDVWWQIVFPLASCTSKEFLE